MTLFDPRIISLTDFVPHVYDTLVNERAILPQMTADRYQTGVTRYHQASDMAVRRMIYRSGDLRITGIMASPVTSDTLCPILIYNRGGNGEFGKIIAPVLMKYIYLFVQNGFLVFASNYNGNDGSDGRDEFGGQDVNSVLDLADIARHHPQWDGRNIYMFGASRGGLMTYLSIKHGLSLNAAVSLAGPSDLLKQCHERDGMARVFARRIPDHEANDRQAYRDRSAIFWPGALTRVPLLLLHGDQDDRVDVGHTVELDAALKRVDAPHKTIIYPGDDHFLSQNWPDAFRTIQAWFDTYKIKETA